MQRLLRRLNRTCATYTLEIAALIAFIVPACFITGLAQGHERIIGLLVAAALAGGLYLLVVRISLRYGETWCDNVRIFLEGGDKTRAVGQLLLLGKMFPQTKREVARLVGELDDCRPVSAEDMNGLRTLLPQKTQLFSSATLSRFVALCIAFYCVAAAMRVALIIVRMLSAHGR